MRAAVTAFLGTASILGAVAFLLRPEPAGYSPLVVALAVLVGVVGVVAALAKVAGSERGDDVASAPWDESGSLVERAPERSPADYDLSGERLAAIVEDAGKTARNEGTVGDGVDAVRPHLREALMGVLVQAGTDRSTAEASLARGTWTDDATAAAALDDAVDHPGWSFFERFEAWLFPEQVVRREVRQAMQAIARTADRELPTVPGQHAPRTVPVLEPTLEDLRRGADGRLQRAVDPLGARSGSHVDGAAVVDGASMADDPDAGSDGQRTNSGRGPRTGTGEGDATDGAAPDDRRPAATESLGDMRLGGDGDEPDEEVTRG